MLTCSNCSAKQLAGTIFCSECGAALLPKPQTKSVPPMDTRRERTVPALPASLDPSPPSAMPAMTLLIGEGQRRVQIAIEDEVLIGRKDEARGIFPEIDLSVEGGYNAGVSRRHAIISRKATVYYVEDLGSANGTFINGQQLAAQVPTVLTNGDELKCGLLVIHVAWH